MTIDRLQQFADVLQRLAGEERRPAYVVDVATLPVKFNAFDGDSLGMWSCTLDVALRQWLQCRGRSQGRGDALALDLRAIRQHARLAGRAFRDQAAGVVLHELAHAHAATDVAAECAHDEDIEPIEADMPLAKLATIPMARKVSEPWFLHDLPFLRAGLLLWWRAAEIGVEPSLTACSLAGRRYGLSPAPAYMAATGNEITDPRPIRQIVRDDPPAALRRLFDEDVERWHEQEEYRSRNRERFTDEQNATT